MRVSCSFVYRDRLCSRYFVVIRVSRHRGLFSHLGVAQVLQ